MTSLLKSWHILVWAERWIRFWSHQHPENYVLHRVHPCSKKFLSLIHFKQVITGTVMWYVCHMTNHTQVVCNRGTPWTNIWIRIIFNKKWILKIDVRAWYSMQNVDLFPMVNLTTACNVLVLNRTWSPLRLHIMYTF